jgi:hypothetical protein
VETHIVNIYIYIYIYICLTFIAITAELMVLGFISLLLTFGQSYISRICLPAKVLNNMLPCSSGSSTESRRRLLWYDRRVLAAGSYAPSCKDVSVSIAQLIFGV